MKGSCLRDKRPFALVNCVQCVLRCSGVVSDLHGYHLLENCVPRIGITYCVLPIGITYCVPTLILCHLCRHLCATHQSPLLEICVPP